MRRSSSSKGAHTKGDRSFRNKLLLCVALGLILIGALLFFFCGSNFLRPAVHSEDPLPAARHDLAPTRPERVSEPAPSTVPAPRAESRREVDETNGIETARAPKRPETSNNPTPSEEEIALDFRNVPLDFFVKALARTLGQKNVEVVLAPPLSPAPRITVFTKAMPPVEALQTVLNLLNADIEWEPGVCRVVPRDAELQPPPQSPIPAMERILDTPVSLECTDARLHDILKRIADATPLNVFFVDAHNENYDTPLAFFRVKDLPARYALNDLLNRFGLAYAPLPNGVRIVRAKAPDE